MKVTLKVWRQAGPAAPGSFVTYEAAGLSPEMSFLEMLDIVNERLVEQGEEPIAFDSDCREGICGMCGLVINGIPHGKQHGAATCQLHMRKFADGDDTGAGDCTAQVLVIVIEYEYECSDGSVRYERNMHVMTKLSGNCPARQATGSARSSSASSSRKRREGRSARCRVRRIASRMSSGLSPPVRMPSRSAS